MVPGGVFDGACRHASESRRATSHHVLPRCRASCLRTPVSSGPAVEGYVLELLGRSGEPLPRKVVNLTLKHAEYAEPSRHTMQTDEAGRVWLGQLPGVVRMEASGADVSFATSLREAQGGLCAFPPMVRAVVGETISLPFPQGAAERVTLLSSLGGRAGDAHHL